MRSVNIASAQYPITAFKSWVEWEEHTRSWVEAAVNGGAQLLLFPEYGSMELVSLLPDLVKADLHLQLEEMQQFIPGFQNTFASLSSLHQITIVAPSFPVMEHGRRINRCMVFGPNGYAGYQDKLFMTRFENETWKVSPGDWLLTVFETTWGKFGIQICYDVEFPIGSALLTKAGAEVIVAPSCTETLRGATRVHVGARARALENQCYTVVAQTIGDAPWSPAVDINFGYSAVYTTPDAHMPEQGIVATETPQLPLWLHESLSLDALTMVRNDGQVFNFHDHQQIAYQSAQSTIAIRHLPL